LLSETTFLQIAGTQLARCGVKKGVDDNLATLKQILETARH
jgi:hypothetical protein